MNCPCNCHDPIMRSLFDMQEHSDCSECDKAIAEETAWIEKQEAELLKRWPNERDS